MERLKSKKFKIPDLYFITNREELKDIPIGIPYVVGNEEDKEYFIRLLEYEVLYQAAIETGLPFDWELILQENGYQTTKIDWHSPIYFDYNESDEGYDKIEEDMYELSSEYIATGEFKNYINDCCALIDMDKLKELHVIPTYKIDVENAVKTNVHDFMVFNPYLYNKKLGGMYGGVEFVSPNRNIIVADISGSMTKSISTYILIESRTMGETFYADVLVTGSISILIPYEELHTMNIEQIYEEVGRGNESEYFKKLLSEHKHYKTAIVFGDNDHPGGYSAYRISDEDGKKLCKWEIDELISFHKDSNDTLAGYSRWFSPKKIQYVKDWVRYLA